MPMFYRVGKKIKKPHFREGMVTSPPTYPPVRPRVNVGQKDVKLDVDFHLVL